MRRGEYRLTEGDKSIIERAKRENNPDVISAYYLRSESSGTYWRPVTADQLSQLEMPESLNIANRWKEQYDTLRDIWKHLGEPEYFGPEKGWSKVDQKRFKLLREELEPVYRVTWEDGDPIFHLPHGPIMLPWQIEAYRDKSPIQVFPGGYGSGKTMSTIIRFLARGIMYKQYRAFALAPYSIQAMEVYTLATNLMNGTLFEERFLISNPTKPFPLIAFGHNEVGRSTIECFPILEDPGKLLTLSGDAALFDQAEKLPEIDEMIRVVSSRFRGTVHGRMRTGQITLCANSAENGQLWDHYDEGLKPGNRTTYSYAPHSFENTNLTIPDLIRFETVVAPTADERRMYLKGERPIGGGDHFPAESLAKIRAQYLDELMKDKLNAKEPGWKRVVQDKCDVIFWQRPPEEGHRYIVCADPGWSNPPYRNSAVVYVFDITNFPSGPAVLAAFHWVAGNGAPDNWITQYQDWVELYRAIAFNGFDSTGLQSGYARMADMAKLSPTPVALSGDKKYAYLNLLKRLMSSSKLELPTIGHFFMQASKYTLPDDKLRQDLVAAMLVVAALLEPFWYMGVQDANPDSQSDYDPFDRDYRRSDDEFWDGGSHHESDDW